MKCLDGMEAESKIERSKLGVSFISLPPTSSCQLLRTEAATFPRACRPSCC